MKNKFSEMWLLALFLSVFAVIAPRSIRAGEVLGSYDVTIDVAALLPKGCPGHSGAGILPIAVGEFKDRQSSRQVAELKKGDETYPVYTDRPIGEIVKEGVVAVALLCGYQLVSSSDRGSSPAITLSGEVSEYRLDWQKKMVTAKGGGRLAVSMKLTAPDGVSYSSFNVRVESEEKGMRKKGVAQIDAQLEKTYAMFLSQLLGLSDFHTGMRDLSQRRSVTGRSSYDIEAEE